VQVKAVYTERREPLGGLEPNPADENVRRHFGLLATSAPFAGFTGEGELVYSQLDALQAGCECNERPMMKRLAFKNRWEALSYGAAVRSFDAGFVSLAGARTEIQRDEGELWGERSWGALKVRGSIAQTWEKPLDSDLRLTRSAATVFDYSKAQWKASLASTYAVVEPAPETETTISHHTIAASYRPVNAVSLAPSVSLRQEWNSGTGVRTETPATGLAFTYTPLKSPFRLTGDTSFSRIFSTDGSSQARIFGTGAALDWSIGRFVGRADKLSLMINYNQRLDLHPNGLSQTDVTGMLRLHVIGF
jgi:hypothetical protein